MPHCATHPTEEHLAPPGPPTSVSSLGRAPALPPPLPLSLITTRWHCGWFPRRDPTGLSALMPQLRRRSAVFTHFQSKPSHRENVLNAVFLPQSDLKPLAAAPACLLGITADHKPSQRTQTKTLRKLGKRGRQSDLILSFFSWTSPCVIVIL